MRTAIEFVLFLAEPFGFGPISSSIAVARQIKRLAPGTECVFAGRGTSHQLATKSNTFDETHFVADGLSDVALGTFNNKMNSGNTVVIANTYPDGVAYAKRQQCPCVFIDTLFWMWNELPVDLSDVETYCIEDFHCADLSIDRFGYSDKFRLFPPLIDVDVDPRAVEHPFVLVSLGGTESDLYGFPAFYYKLIDAIANDKNLQQFTVLVCGGGSKFNAREFKRYEHPRLTITCLGPHEYISYLRAADVVFSSPGLHGFYENYFLEKNVMFLPPINYSQYLQLKFIKSNFTNVVGLNLEDIGIPHVLRENMPEMERINEVKRANRLLVEESVMTQFLYAFRTFYAGGVRTSWADEIRKCERRDHGPLMLAQAILS